MLTNEEIGVILFKHLREWRNRQTRTFEGRVVIPYGFKSRLSHQKRHPIGCLFYFVFARSQLRLSALADNFISNLFELHSRCEPKNEVMLRINEVLHNEVLRNKIAYGKRN